MSNNNDYGNEAINNIVSFVPYINTFFDDDVMIMISDTEKVLFYQPSSEMNFGSEIGSSIKGTPMDEVISRGKTTVNILPKEFKGVSFKAYMIPIKNGDEIVGGISIGKSLTKKEKVSEITNKLVDSIKKMSSEINNISGGIEELDKASTSALEETKDAKKMTDDTDEVVDFIRNISSQTNLLGLNASIEAARAGEEGRGFSVVAKEIRKLSVSSKESIGKIDDVIKSISYSIDNIDSKIENTNKLSKDQSQSIHVLKDAIDELKNTSELLERLSDNL